MLSNGRVEIYHIQGYEGCIRLSLYRVEPLYYCISALPLVYISGFK